MGEKNEQDAVRTTIVGGRPPGSGRSNVAVPRGIEVLLKKAAVDPDFRQILLEQRDGAAAAIELQLAPAERAMLKAIPDEQLKLIVGQTTVPVQQRRVFLGRVAAAMLATISAGLASCTPRVESAGIRPLPPGTDGIRPDRPMPNSTNAPGPIPPSTNQPVEMPAPLTQGIRPDRPSPNSTNASGPSQPTTNEPIDPRPFLTRGIQPDRP